MKIINRGKIVEEYTSFVTPHIALLSFGAKYGYTSTASLSIA